LQRNADDLWGICGGENVNRNGKINEKVNGKVKK
jgi:hypothetical protein